MNWVLVVVGITMLAVGGMLYRKLTKKREELQNELMWVRRFKRAQHYANEALLVYDEQGEVVYVNDKASDFFGLNAGDNLDEKVSDVFLRYDSDSSGKLFTFLESRIPKTYGAISLKKVFIQHGGKSNIANVYFDKRMRKGKKHYVLTIDFEKDKIYQDDTQKEKSDELIYYDPITELPDRQQAVTDLSHMALHATEEESFALMVLGVDDYGHIRSALSYGGRIRLMKTIAENLRTISEDLMHIYKMDCDRFLIVLPKMSDEEISDVARMLIEQVPRHEDVATLPVNFTISLGVGRFPQDGGNVLRLLDRVYRVLDRIQNKGGSGFDFCGEDDVFFGISAERLADDIRKGMKEGEFFIVYQPIFDMLDEKVVSVEALLRWDHPKFGVVEAETFIESAIRIGMGLEINSFVFETVAQMLHRWKEKNALDLTVSINISSKEMMHTSISDRIGLLLKRYRIDPRYLSVDIDARELYDTYDAVIEEILKLKEIGLTLSLDHFGSGVVSMQLVGDLPFSSLKIDRSVIVDTTFENANKKILKGVLALSKELGYELIIKGIETSQEVKLLSDMGYRYAQGYLFAKPLRQDELEELVIH